MTSSKCGALIGCSPAPLDSVRSSSQENVVKRNTEIYIKRKNSEKSKKVLDKNMESLVHVLCALFGMASWLGKIFYLNFLQFI